MTMHRKSVYAVIALLAVSLATLWGCEGTTRQGTLYSIQPNRELHTFLPGDLATVHEAALEVVKTEFGYTVEESAIDAMEGIVKARTATGHQIRVQTAKHGERITRIEVYAGPSGSESVAREILSAIESRLTESGPGK
jgi:hypothetical protein